MVIAVGYPCFASGEPRRLSATDVMSVASALRQRIFGLAFRTLDLSDLIRRTRHIRVNGQTQCLEWDVDHSVHDNDGNEVLGVCEHDPAAPGTVMISLNAGLLEGSAELLRSTAIHELAHAIFDMPAAVATGIRRAFRSGTELRKDGPEIDWREWRADEFMGAFLVPRRQLARSFARQAAAHGINLHWADAEIPTPFVSAASADCSAADAVAAALAEEFGVSEAFIAVRLKKYRMVR